MSSLLLAVGLTIILASSSFPYHYYPRSAASSPLFSSIKPELKIEKFGRLPVWPVQNGLIRFVVSRFSEKAGVFFERVLGGSVCPNFFDPSATSPFILLVHHNHKFISFDPIRPLSSLILPEGFPAHPHRGFVTLTICLKGGLVHRDSCGVKQRYGATPQLHRGNFGQWLMTGRGLLHEEMWDVDSGQDQELYQIWIDLPRDRKMDEPLISLISDDDCVVDRGDNNGEGVTRTIIVDSTIPCGPKVSSAMTVSTISFAKRGDVCLQRLSRECCGTIIVYIRGGGVMINGGDEVKTHHTAFVKFPPGPNELVDINIEATEDSTEILLLAGEPLKQRVVAKGSMVMTSEKDIQEAYFDYERGKFGLPWRHTLTDDQWKAHTTNESSSST